MIQQVLALWEEREPTRFELLAAIDLVEASLARGEGRIITGDAMPEWAEDIKRRGRTRVATKQLSLDNVLSFITARSAHIKSTHRSQPRRRYLQASAASLPVNI